MRSFTLLLLLSVLVSPVAWGEEGFRRWSVFAGAGPALFRINNTSTVQARPLLGIEIAFPVGLTLGNHFAYVEAPFGPGRVYQTSVGFRFGWWVLERLQLVARYDYVSTRYTGYNSASHEGFGFEANTRLPLGEKRRWVLLLGGGWSRANQVTLSRDTGQPVTNSQFANSLCELFTFGISSGCGNIMQYMTVPKSSYWHANAAIAWSWGK